MKLAATGPHVGAAEGGLLDVGYFLTMGVINPYGLVTVPWDFYSKTFFYLGGPFLKGRRPILRVIWPEQVENHNGNKKIS